MFSLWRLEELLYCMDIYLIYEVEDGNVLFFSWQQFRGHAKNSRHGQRMGIILRIFFFDHTTYSDRFGRFGFDRFLIRFTIIWSSTWTGWNIGIFRRYSTDGSGRFLRWWMSWKNCEKLVYNQLLENLYYLAFSVQKVKHVDHSKVEQYQSLCYSYLVRDVILN